MAAFEWICRRTLLLACLLVCHSATVSAEAGDASSSVSPTATLEGTLAVHPKYLYREYLTGFADGQSCALRGLERFEEIEAGSRIAVTGRLGTRLHSGGTADNPSPFGRTWYIYMDVETVKVLAPPIEWPHDGVWKPIAAAMNGRRLPGEAVKLITLKIDGDAYEVTVEGEEKIDRGTVKLDTSTRPRRMTITGTDGPNKGKTILAIYEKKDAVSMRVCYDLSGKEFPKEFKAPQGSALYLVGYRRQRLEAPRAQATKPSPALEQ